MLESTKTVKKELISAGISRKGLTVRTSFNHKGEYQSTSICVFDSVKYCKFKIIRTLLKFGYGLVIAIKDNKAVHLSIFTDWNMKGLKIFDLNQNKFIKEFKEVKR